MTARDDLLAHLATGTTTTCRCWGVTRADGLFLGFTDHDRDLSFDNMTFKAASGMTAKAIDAGTGAVIWKKTIDWPSCTRPVHFANHMERWNVPLISTFDAAGIKMQQVLLKPSAWIF